MGIRPLQIFNSVSTGIDFGRQNLTSIDVRKVDPCAERVKGKTAVTAYFSSNWHLSVHQTCFSIIRRCLLGTSKWAVFLFSRAYRPALLAVSYVITAQGYNKTTSGRHLK